MLTDKYKVQYDLSYLKAVLGACLDEIAERLEQPIWKFSPYPKQQQFYEATGKFQKSLFIGSNKSGKTLMGAWTAAQIFTGNYPYRKFKEPPVIWIVGLDKPNALEPVIKPMFLSFLGVEGIDYRYDRKYDYVEHFKTKAIAYFKSCDSGVSKFQGANIDCYWCDEEPPEEIYSELNPRLIARNGFGYFTFTPTNGYSWSHDELFQNPDVFHVKASMYDNPFLSTEVVRKYEEDLTEEEKRMRVYGDYVELGGRKVFDYQITDKIVKPKISEPLFSGDIMDGGFIDSEEGCCRVWVKPQKGQVAFIGVDTSEGVADKTAVEVMIYENGVLKQAMEYDRLLELDLIHRVVLEIGKIYHNPLLIVENNNSGEAVIQRIKYEYRGRIYSEETSDGYGSLVTKRLGFRTSGNTKLKMVRDFNELARSGKIEIYSEKLLRQMEAFIETKNKKMRSNTGHDDMVMAVMLAVQGFMSNQYTAISKQDRIEKHEYFRKVDANSRVAWHMR